MIFDFRRELKLSPFFENLKLVCFVSSWISCISLIIWTSNANIIADVGSFLFVFVLLLTIPALKVQSIFIISFLIFLFFVISNQMPSKNTLFDSLNYILIFAGLIPTLGLVRATAFRLISVKESQSRLSKLSENHMAPGFQLAAHLFGAVINTGVFAMLSAALPKTSSSNYRKLAAEAALRGMSSSAIWSPFFVAFVVGQTYIDPVNAWTGLAVGVGVALVFSICSIMAINKGNFFTNIVTSTSCLFPVLPILIFIIFVVITAAIFFKLTALSAIIIVMPILVSLYFCYRPDQVRSIVTETVAHLKSSTDDIVVISVAMIIGFLITKDLNALKTLSNLQIFSVPSWFILIFIPTAMASLSLIGIHPVISSTVLLSIFTNSNSQISAPLIMQAHLIGWCTGTMSSISSLSVITCSRLFNTSSIKLCYGVNTVTTLLFALIGGTILSVIERIL